MPYRARPTLRCLFQELRPGLADPALRSALVSGKPEDIGVVNLDDLAHPLLYKAHRAARRQTSGVHPPVADQIRHGQHVLQGQGGALARCRVAGRRRAARGCARPGLAGALLPVVRERAVRMVLDQVTNPGAHQFGGTPACVGVPGLDTGSNGTKSTANASGQKGMLCLMATAAD